MNNRYSENTTCPTCNRDDFKSEQGMKQHHSKSHNYSLNNISRKCSYCNEQYTIEYTETQCFCSQECIEKSFFQDGFDKYLLYPNENNQYINDLREVVDSWRLIYSNQAYLIAIEKILDITEDYSESVYNINISDKEQSHIQREVNYKLTDKENFLKKHSRSDINLFNINSYHSIYQFQEDLINLYTSKIKSFLDEYSHKNYKQDLEELLINTNILNEMYYYPIMNLETDDLIDDLPFSISNEYFSDELVENIFNTSYSSNKQSNITINLDFNFGLDDVLLKESIDKQKYRNLVHYYLKFDMYSQIFAITSLPNSNYITYDESTIMGFKENSNVDLNYINYNFNDETESSKRLRLCFLDMYNKYCNIRDELLKNKTKKEIVEYLGKFSIEGFEGYDAFKILTVYRKSNIAKRNNYSSHRWRWSLDIKGNAWMPTIIGCDCSYAYDILRGINKISKSKKNSVINYYNNSCVYCKNTDNLVVHHIIPRSQDGSNKYNNLVCLCKECHWNVHSNGWNNIKYNNKTEFWDKINNNEF